MSILVHTGSQDFESYVLNGTNIRF